MKTIYIPSLIFGNKIFLDYLISKNIPYHMIEPLRRRYPSQLFIEFVRPEDALLIELTFDCKTYTNGTKLIDAPEGYNWKKGLNDL